MTDNVIDVQSAVRRYGSRTAVRDVSLAVPAGSITALVGPNGSGKTTLLKMIAGLVRPTAGRVSVLGHDPWARRVEVMRRARFAFAPPALYPQLTARETLRVLSAIGMAPAERPAPTDIQAALDAVGLARRADEPVRVFSFGMRQRLILAQAMLPRPLLLVLDEPTDGLDPLAVLELRDVLLRLCRREGVTILLSSHLLIEVEKLVDQMLVLDEGATVFSGHPDELRAGRRHLRLTFEQKNSNIERAASLLAERGIKATRAGEGALKLPAGALTLDAAVALFSGHELHLAGFEHRTPSLEEALLDRLRASRNSRTAAVHGSRQREAIVR